MSTILNRMKEMSEELTNSVKKFANKKFMNAAAASAALIAMADGHADASETNKMIGFMRINESLKVFKIDEVIDTFKIYLDRLKDDTDLGQISAFDAIGKCRKNVSEARALMHLSCAIGAADGDFDKDEKAMANRIALELHLNSSEFFD